jgi:hypothetical protein
MKNLKLSVITNSNPQTSSVESEIRAQERRSQFKVLDGGRGEGAKESNFFILVDAQDKSTYPKKSEIKTGFYHMYATTNGFTRLVTVKKIAA